MTSDKNDQVIEYTPLGEATTIKLSASIIRKFVVNKTRQGAEPSEADVVTFLHLCRARQLNPFVRDAFLVGYDSKDGPTWSLITAIQALYKRAEQNPMFRGMRSGIIVTAEGAEKYKLGAYLAHGETLVGAWAEVWRSDRDMPSTATIGLSAYNLNRSRWSVDPAGMLAKCARAAALREAFALETHGMMIDEEMSLSPGEIAITSEPKTIGDVTSQINAAMPVIESPTRGAPETDRPAGKD